ncbi:MAG: hypothetical protein ACTHU0_25110 [Kofleriaceae bacterium]
MPMTPISPRLLLSLALLAACGDNLAGPGDDDPMATGHRLTGEHIVRFRAFNGTPLGRYPVDLWDSVIEAHAPDGDGWRVIPGQGHRDGSFEIRGVPDGDVWLRISRLGGSDAFYWTDAERVTFEEPLLGAPDGPRGEDGDQLFLAVDGVDAWQPGDELSLYVPEDNVIAQDVVAGAPAPGTTDLAGMPIDWTGRLLANVEPDEPAFLVQYRVRELGGVEVRAPIRATNPQLRQVPGDDATLTATLIEPPVLPYRFRWARDAFEAERTAIHPTRTGASYYHDYSMTALPSRRGDEVWGGMEMPMLMLADPSVLEGTTELDLGVIPLPNPYPREWLFDSHVVVFPVALPLPNGEEYTLDAAIGLRRNDFTGEAVRPALTPIRAPTLAGRDAFADQSGVGAAPVLAWQLPETGEPTAHRIQVIEAVLAPPVPYQPGWYITAELYVPGDVTSVRLPADLLRADTTYSIVVRSMAQPGQDIRTRPMRNAGVAAFADAVLGRFTR